MSDPNLAAYLFEGDTLIRCVQVNGVPMFVAIDICRAIDLKNTAQALEPLDDDEKGICSGYTVGGNQDLLVVTEGGLYTLMLRSRAAVTHGTVAHRFRRWVTDELLPQIRQSGSYFRETQPIAGLATAPRDVAETDDQKLRKVAEARLTFGPRAAAELWLKLELDAVPAMFRVNRQMDLFASD